MSYENFIKDLDSGLSNDSKIIIRKLSRYVHGTDGSMYRLVPKMVIIAKNYEDAIYIVKSASCHQVPVTFKASGTSLSGQASTDSVLVIVRDGFTNISIINGGEMVKAGVGVRGARVNLELADYNKKIGSDPASVDAASVGGIVANNATGMCCTLQNNSYASIADVTFVLADGTYVDTSNKESLENFKILHRSLLQKLEKLASELKSHNNLVELIKRKYKIRNTTGFSVNSLVDYSDGIDILKHLLVGSEGCLALLLDVTLKTVDTYKYSNAALIFFKDIVQASSAISDLHKHRSDVDAAEFMDAKSLKAVSNMQGLEYLKDFDDNVCAMLLQISANDKDELERRLKLSQDTLANYELERPLEFTDDKELIKQYWKIRAGIFPIAGSIRRSGSNVIIEDLTFPVDKLSEGVTDLKKLFVKHDLKDVLVFGHALEGNLHFILTIDNSNTEEISSYAAFMKDFVDLITVKYKGSLKAEHGTGRNMAPFVEYEWGGEIYRVMKRIKNILDPENIFNPDVILTNDDKLHIKNLKVMPETFSRVDKCIECGFCEPTCPTRDFSFSPRERIVAYRSLEDRDPSKFSKEFIFNAIDSCTNCGLCEIACPVDIHTGKLMLELKHQVYKKEADKLYNSAKNFKSFMFKSRFQIISANLASLILTKRGLSNITKMTKAVFPSMLYMPPTMPVSAKKVNYKTVKSDKKFVYLPSCVNRMMGHVDSKGAIKKGMVEVVVSLAKKAGYEIIIPKKIDNYCCGGSFKGSKEAQELKLKESIDMMTKYSENGKYPVVSDLSSCTHYLHEGMDEINGIKLYDIVEFADKFLVKELEIEKSDEPIAIHVTCALKTLGLGDTLINLTKLISSNIVIPKEISCCGFAGDLGMKIPDLNSTALKDLKTQVSSCSCGVSANTLCEMGLSANSGITYQSVLHHIDAHSTTAIK